jgi:hypothetical protein
LSNGFERAIRMWIKRLRLVAPCCARARRAQSQLARAIETIRGAGTSWDIWDIHARSLVYTIQRRPRRAVRDDEEPLYIRARCAACAPRAQHFLANPLWPVQNEEKKISVKAFLTFGALHNRAHEAQRLSGTRTGGWS